MLTEYELSESTKTMCEKFDTKLKELFNKGKYNKSQSGSNLKEPTEEKTKKEKPKTINLGNNMLALCDEQQLEKVEKHKNKGLIELMRTLPPKPEPELKKGRKKVLDLNECTPMIMTR